MKELILIIFLHVNSISGVPNYRCTDAQRFHDENKKHFSKAIQTAAGNGNLLRVLESRSIPIGRGGFGTVKAIDGVNEKYIIKIQNPHDYEDIVALQREIMLLKLMCGKIPVEVFHAFIDCQKSEVAAFKGCVQVNTTVYIFQLRGYGSLENKELLDKYRALEPIRRIVVFLKILDLVAGLHKRKVIHSDIKPANIVTLDVDLNEFELIDLGTSGPEGGKFDTGTPFFLPPECSLSINKIFLTPQIDVYSLAMTFMFLEVNFRDHCLSLDSYCFKYNLSSKCHKDLMDGVYNTLSADEELNKLAPIFKTALEYDTINRHPTVEAFSREIVQNLAIIKNFECYFNEIRIEKETEALLKPKNPQNAENVENAKNVPAPLKKYRWMDFAEELGFFKYPEIAQKAAQNINCRRKVDLNSPTNLIQKQQNQLSVDQNYHEYDEYHVKDEPYESIGAKKLEKVFQMAFKPGRIFKDQSSQGPSVNIDKGIGQKNLKPQQNLLSNSFISQKYQKLQIQGNVPGKKSYVVI